MSSEAHNSLPKNRAGASGSGTNGWPVRNDNPTQWWGKRQDAPTQGDSSRLNMFAKPVEMTQGEKNRILSNWRNVTEGWPETRAMNPELRPSTPRDVRADKKIQMLREEGVGVDAQMERHIRNVVVKNSGLHEALRHYTEGESNELIPYLNEMLHREDRMLVEWAKQRQADYEFYENSSQYRGSLRGLGGKSKASSRRESRESTPERTYEELQSSDDEASSLGDGSPAGGPSQPMPLGPSATIGTEPHPSQDDADTQGNGALAEEPSQGESANASGASKGPAQAEQGAETEEMAARNGRIQMILDLEVQIADTDRRIFALQGKAANSAPLAGNPWFDQQDPFDRVFELMRTVLEEKQRRLCKLNQQIPSKAKAGKGGLLGSWRNTWKRCVDGADSADSSPNGSQVDPRDNR